MPDEIRGWDTWAQNLIPAAVFGAGEDDEVEFCDAEADAAAPVDGVVDAVAHGEM